MNIPGGTDFLGRHFDDFVVGDEHTVFDWCKVCVDQNPNEAAPYYLSATVKGRERRLTTVGAIGSNVPGARPHPTETDVDDDGTEQEFNEAIRITLTTWDDKAAYRIQNTIYQQLAERIRTGRIEYQPVYLDDLPGELDQTLCVIGKDPVLDIAERIGGCGRAIADLLALRQAAAAHAASAVDSPDPTTPTPTDQSQEPSTAELAIGWFRSNFKKGDKRNPAIEACRNATGALWREALAAYRQLPEKLKRRRGGRDRLPSPGKSSKGRPHKNK
jgi:hypothetical protein